MAGMCVERGGGFARLSGPIGWPSSEMSSEISEVVVVLGASLALSLIFDRDVSAACAAAAAGGPAA